MVSSVEIKIYLLRSPLDSRVYYVGATVTKLKRRLCAHVCNARSAQPTKARKGKLSKKDNWIRSLLNLGLKPSIELLEITNDLTAEGIWFQHFKDAGEPLTNTNGIHYVNTRTNT